MRVHLMPDGSVVFDSADPDEAVKAAIAWKTAPLPGTAQPSIATPVAATAEEEPVRRLGRPPSQLGWPSTRSPAAPRERLTVEIVREHIKKDNIRAVYERFIAAGPGGANLARIVNELGYNPKYPGVFLSSMTATAGKLGVHRSDIIREKPDTHGWYFIPLLSNPKNDAEEGPG